MKRIVLFVGLVVWCVSGFARMSGQGECGAQLELNNVNGRGRDPITKDQIRALEEQIGEELMLVSVDVNNATGTADWFFTTWCCNSAMGVKGGGDNKAWVNLREAADKAGLPAGVQALFGTQKVSPGGNGQFLIGWRKSDGNSLSAFSAVQFLSSGGYVMGECK